jgi:hypothetical protein
MLLAVTLVLKTSGKMQRNAGQFGIEERQANMGMLCCLYWQNDIDLHQLKVFSLGGPRGLAGRSIREIPFVSAERALQQQRGPYIGRQNARKLSKRWLAGFARLIARQACNALRHEPRLPPPYHRLGFAGPPLDLGRAAAFGGGKDDFGAPNMLLRHVAVTDNRLKPTAISRSDVDDNSCSHDESLNCFGQIWESPE